jgi:microcystin-dependent protein
VPIGSITIWAGGSDNGSVQTFNVPTGWLLCDGAEYQRSAYSDLFNVIGTKYGLNKPNTGLNFYVPDLTFAVPMGTPYRNYTSTIFSPSPFQVYVQSWQSDFAPPATPSSKTWKINQTVGGTLNYGTMFPASGFTIPGFPTLYVSQILSYDGYQGYIVVKSVNGAAIPDIPGGNQIIVQADGTAPQDASGTYLYTLGSYGVNSGYPQVTHNQKQNEVYPHTHQYSQITTSANVQNFTGTTIFSVNAAANVQTGFNTSNTISTIGIVNTATYTAPNFLNMLYIIKY